MKKYKSDSIGESFLKVHINSRVPQKDIEISCNNNCKVCISKNIQACLFDLSTKDIENKKIILEGREPTIQKKFWQVSKYLYEKTDEYILVTNGRVFFYKNWAKKIANIKPSRIIIKLFGCNEILHDQHTNITGSFSQAIAAIRNLRAKGVVVRIAFYAQEILDKTYQSLKDIQPYINLSYSLTNTLPVILSKRDDGLTTIEVLGENKKILSKLSVHPGNHRYDMLTYVGDTIPHAWKDSHFPMIHILTGPACNIQCVYCNVHGGDKPTQFLYDFEYVKDLICDAVSRDLHKQNGKPVLDLIGGEPTLHPQLAELISFAKDVGFQFVEICTNGLKLLKPNYLQNLIDAGIDAIRFSFHSHEASISAKLASAPNTGKKYLSVAKLLLEQTTIVTYFYRILLSTTIDSFPQYVDWLIKNNHTGKKIYLNVGMPSPRGRMFANSHLFPNLDRCRELVQLVIDKYSSSELELTLHHSPGCLIPGRPELSATNNLEARQYEIGIAQPVVLNFEGDTQYSENCKSCSSYQKCPGVPQYYLSQNSSEVEKWVKPQR